MEGTMLIKTKGGKVYAIGQVYPTEHYNLVNNEISKDQCRIRVWENDHGPIIILAGGPSTAAIQQVMCSPELIPHDQELTIKFLEKDFVPALHALVDNNDASILWGSDRKPSVLLSQNGKLFSISYKGGVEQDSKYLCVSYDEYAAIKAVYEKYDGELGDKEIEELIEVVSSLDVPAGIAYYLDSENHEIRFYTIRGLI